MKSIIHSKNINELKKFKRKVEYIKSKVRCSDLKTLKFNCCDTTSIKGLCKMVKHIENCRNNKRIRKNWKNKLLDYIDIQTEGIVYKNIEESYKGR